MEEQINNTNIPVSGTAPEPQPQQNAAPVQQPQANPYTAAPPQQPVNPYMTPPPQYRQPAPYTAPPVQGQPQFNAYMAPPVGAQPMQYIPKPKPIRRKGTTRDLVMAILSLVTCFIMTDSYIWTGTLGLGFTIGAVLFLALEVWYIAPVLKRRSVYSVACILLYSAGCLSLVFSADHFMKFLTFVCLIVLTTCMLMDSMELRAWDHGSFRAIGDYFYTGYAASFGRLAHGMYGLFHLEKKEGSNKKKRIVKALLGLAIAIPFVLLLGFLLYNGDEAFRGMLDSIDIGKLPNYLLSLILAVPIFILLFSRLFSLPDIKRERREETGKGLDPFVLTFFLLGICLVYMAYLFSQLAYFFNGFLGFLPEDFTYAGYARRGFFELSVVSVINIFTVIISAAFCRKKEGKLPLSVKLISLFLCIFSLLIAFTEVAKLKMYMDSYGLTRLRILTTLFTVFLAVIFILLIVRLFVRKLPYMKAAVVIGAALVIALSFINIDGVIARYNVDAYRSGKLKTLDVRTITSLDDSAVPSLIELASDDDHTVSQQAADSLYRRWKDLHDYHRVGFLETDDYFWGPYDFDRKIGDLKDLDWRGFNLPSYQARELLLENEEMIISKH